jgi:NAD(P)-dependent dehydrogenase (short-subunit alcohol dehydrogenase family)
VTSVLVTGANSGIGTATTTALLDRGAHVVGTVRTGATAAKLRRHFHDHDLTVARLDVTDADTARSVMERHRPDVVVNCAGDALLGAMVDIGDDAARDQLETLVIAPVRLARLAAAQADAAGRVRVVNVSSSMAETTFPFTGWYGAAKAALDTATDALRLELAPRGIEVIRIECGAVRTAAWDGAAGQVEASIDPASLPSRRRWGRLTTLARPAFADPDEVGSVIARAALDPDPDAVYRVGFGSRLGIVSALVPSFVEDSITSLVFGLKAARS